MKIDLNIVNEFTRELKIELQWDELKSDFDKCSCCNKLLKDCINFSNQHNRIRTKFLNNLIKKIKEVSDNGKDEDALDIINKIFSYNE